MLEPTRWSGKAARRLFSQILCLLTIEAVVGWTSSDVPLLDPVSWQTPAGAILPASGPLLKEASYDAAGLPVQSSEMIAQVEGAGDYMSMEAICSVVTVGGMSFAMLGVAFIMRDAARNKSTLINFFIDYEVILSLTSYTCIVPTIHHLVVRLGGEANAPSISGLAISASMGLTFVTLPLAVKAINANSDPLSKFLFSMRTGSRAICYFFYAMAGICGWSVWIPVICRMLEGFALGCTNTLMPHIQKMVTPHDDLPKVMVNNAFFKNIGIGMGPLLSSVVLLLPHAGVEDDTFPAFAMSIFSASFFLLLYLGGFFNCVGLCEKIEEPPAAGGASSTPASGPAFMTEDDKSKLMWCTLALNFIRGYMVSNLETASAFMLETIYKLTPKTIGFVIGFLFLFGVPLRLMFQALIGGRNYSNSTMITIYQVMALCGTILIIPQDWFITLGKGVLGPQPNKLYPILCGDIIVFMCVTLTEALVSAQCMQRVDGALLTKFLAMNSLGGNLSRLIGPLTGRSLIDAVAKACLSGATASDEEKMEADRKGQLAYAIHLAAINVCAIVMYRLGSRAIVMRADAAAAAQAQVEMVEGSFDDGKG